MSIVRNFNLYLNAGNGSAPYINVNQYDQGEQWVFTLYKEYGTKYTPSTGAIVGIKADNRGIINTGTVDADGRVVINETQQMTAAAGIAIFELLIDGDSHGTANFLVNVERRPGDNADLSDSDLSLIQQAVDSAAVIIEVIGDSDPSEVIGEHVDDWLDNHPEATTTVLDGAITAPKLNNSLWDKLLVNEEASGAVASFDDGADDVPVSSLKVNLEPIQTGTGDPSPTNIRPIYPANGKNMFDPSTLLSGYYADKDADTLSGSTTNYRTAELALYQGTYTISFSNTVNIVRYREKGITSSSNVATGVKSYTFTVSTNATVALGFRMPDVAWDDSTTIQIERGSVATPYLAYQSIMVDRVGKNLLLVDAEHVAKPAPWTGTWTGTTVYGENGLKITRSNGEGGQGGAWCWLKPGKYTISFDAEFTNATGYGFNLRLYDPVVGASYVNVSPTNITASHYAYTFECTVDTLVIFRPFARAWNSGATHEIFLNRIMLEYGGTASDFEPYQSNTYHVSLSREVYGGSVDLATGVLTVTHEYHALSEFTNWIYSDNNFFYQAITGKKAGTVNIICDEYQTKVRGTWTSSDDCVISGNGNTSQVYIRDSRYTTVADFRANVTASICYELATPQTIQLTPTQVNTLLGYNNISSSGTVDVIYHADTKLYVDKMTAVDNNIIAPTEQTFTATRNYTVNDLVIVNDTLYKVTANIATGSAITPNSNVTQTTLSALIKALS